MGRSNLAASMTRTQQAFHDGVPSPPATCILTWAEQNVKLIGSARSEGFDRHTAPWLNDILLGWADEVTRRITLVGPVQSGKSAAGEIALMHVIAFDTGFIQYNWPNDPKADLRWASRFEKILRACKSIQWPEDRNRIRKRQVEFPRCFFNMQGVWVPDRLDSDSVKKQVNEEVHDWEPGHLAKAYNRTTAFSWISKILNISNAGRIGDQLHQAFRAGTQQHWEVKCPGCGLYHEMRTRWEDDKPDLGGLRYDSKACKRDDGTYNYELLKSTLRYQMPCGHIVREDVRDRRALSLSGKYSAPHNTGADLSERSYTMEGVAVDWIPWITLVKEKHEALRALRYGDPAPWDKYLRERESRFFDPTDRPLTQRIVLNTQARKNREGLPDREMRGMTIDKQRGRASRGDTPHLRVVIRDFRADASSQLVYEGRLSTIEEVEAVRADHEVIVGQWPDPSFVLIDSGWDTAEVYRICSRYGYTALKGEDRAHYNHDDEDNDGNPIKVKRIYSTVQLVDPFEGNTEGMAGRYQIPLIFYSKPGVMDRLAWLRSRGRSVNEEWNEELERAFPLKVRGEPAKPWKFFDVPGDVSDDYKRHMETWDLKEHVIGRTQESVMLWTKVAEGAADDSFMCECYQALLAEMSGLLKE